jgi:hypothetical protein
MTFDRLDLKDIYQERENDTLGRRKRKNLGTKSLPKLGGMI